MPVAAVQREADDTGAETDVAGVRSVSLLRGGCLEWGPGITPGVFALPLIGDVNGQARNKALRFAPFEQRFPRESRDLTQSGGEGV